MDVSATDAVVMNSNWTARLGLLWFLFFVHRDDLNDLREVFLGALLAGTEVPSKRRTDGEDKEGKDCR